MISITVNGTPYSVPSSAADVDWAADQVAFEQALAGALNAVITSAATNATNITALAAKFVSGTGTLSSGAATVLTSAVSASSRIFLTHGLANGNVGTLFVNVRLNGVSFGVESTSIGDDGDFDWLIYNP
jgi:hypothetical protein